MLLDQLSVCARTRRSKDIHSPAFVDPLVRWILTVVVGLDDVGGRREVNPRAQTALRPSAWLTFLLGLLRLEAAKAIEVEGRDGEPHEDGDLGSAEHAGEPTGDIGELAPGYAVLGMSGW